MQVLLAHRNDSRSNSDLISELSKHVKELDRRQNRVYEIVQTMTMEARELAKLIVQVLGRKR